jgi:hypothetical protein
VLSASFLEVQTQGITPGRPDHFLVDKETRGAEGNIDWKTSVALYRKANTAMADVPEEVLEIPSMRTIQARSRWILILIK